MELMQGVIHGVFPPGSAVNSNKFQYEYLVLATGPLYTPIPLHHVLRSDQFGATDEFDDSVLEVGNVVLVACLKDYSQAFIVGGIRNSRKITADSLGHHSRRRYNAIEVLVDKDKNYSVTSDSGPNLHVKTDKIILNDSAGEVITLDKANKILTVEANELKIVVVKNATIQVGGNVKLTAAKLDATISGDCTVKASKLKANISGSADITAGTKATIKAPLVDLGSGVGPVVTTLTHPVDYVTGIPIVGLPNVKAG